MALEPLIMLTPEPLNMPDPELIACRPLNPDLATPGPCTCMPSSATGALVHGDLPAAGKCGAAGGQAGPAGEGLEVWASKQSRDLLPATKWWKWW